MQANNLVKEITAYCKANANRENVKKFSRFFKEEYIAYGLTQPQIGIKVKELLKNQEYTLQIILDAAKELIASAKYEEPSFIMQMVNGRGKKFSATTFIEIETWYTKSINNWAHADTLGMMILPQFFKHKVINLANFKPWFNSANKFQRRCIPVTLIKVIKSNKSADFTPYFSFIEPLITDKEREVHQGVGWFLREAWKIQPAATETFLLKWKDIAPRLIIQYATEKMTKEYKEKFKRKK